MAKGSFLDPRTARRFAWFAMLMSFVALGLAVLSSVFVGPVPWTQWAGPLLVIANVGVFAFDVPRRWPRLARPLTYVVLAITVAVIVVVVLPAASR